MQTIAVAHLSRQDDMLSVVVWLEGEQRPQILTCIGRHTCTQLAGLLVPGTQTKLGGRVGAEDNPSS